MKISQHDEQNLHRLLDDALSPAEAAALRLRLEAEPALRRHYEAAQRLRAGFAAVRATGAVAPVGFTAGVLAGVRRLPSRQELEEREVGDSIVRLCRRLLVAAALVFGLGFAWRCGLLDGSRSNTLEAAPDKVQRETQRELDRLDALIQSGALGSGASGSGVPGSGTLGERKVK